MNVVEEQGSSGVNSRVNDDGNIGAVSCALSVYKRVIFAISVKHSRPLVDMIQQIMEDGAVRKFKS